MSGVEYVQSHGPGMVDPSQILPIHERQGILTAFKSEIAALNLYAGYTQDDRDIAQPLRTLTSFMDFCGTRVTKPVMNAAVLGILGSRTVSDDPAVKDGALNALKTYGGLVGPDTQEFKDTLAHLADQNEFNTFINAGRLAVAAEDPETLATLTLDPRRSPSRYAWLKLALGKTSTWQADPIIGFLTEQTNVEVGLIQAASTFEFLRNPRGNDVRLFQAAYDVRSFLGPLAKPMRHDGLSMAVQNMADITCLEKAGETDALRNAEEALMDYKDADEIMRTANKVLEGLLGGYHVTRQSVEDTSQHGTIVAESILEKTGQAYDIEVKIRAKSEGSWAVKSLKKPGEDINDPIGMTAVVPNVEAVGELFQSILASFGTTDAFSLANVPPGGAAVHVRGDRDYIGFITSKISELEDIYHDGGDLHFDVETQENDSPEEFRFAKIQFVLNSGSGHRVELVVQAKDDRHNGRVGKKANHWSYKNSGSQASLLSEIHQRVATMHEGKIVPVSEARGENLRQLIDEHPGLPKDYKKR